VDRSLKVRISAPDSDTHHYVVDRIPLTVLVEDGESMYDDVELTWNSDIEGDLDVFMDHSGGGEFSGSVRLGVGDHLLTVTASDSDENTDIEQVVVDVGPENSPPSCEIVYPEDGQVGFPGELLTLTAEITDPDVASNYLMAEWASTLQGPLGNSAVSSDGRSVLPVEDLLPGTHTLQLVARDELDGLCTDLVVFQVGTGPSVVINSPEDGAIISEGASVEFSGAVSDSIDSPSDLTVQWRSDADGVLNEMPPDLDGNMEFQIDELSRGHHTIMLLAVNSAEMSNNASITVTVNGVPTQPEVEIVPPDPNSSEDLVASITVDSVDPDGDAVDYRYTWTQNGTVVLDGDTSVVSAEVTTKGDVWRLTVTPSDGLTDGTPAEVEVIIGNTPPQILTVALSPDPADTTDDFLCDYTGLTDWDGDGLTVVTQWTVSDEDGDEVLPVTTPELDKAWTRRGDSVYCEVTPHDGFMSGETLRSNVVTIDNSAPYALAVFIDPEAVRAGDTPRCVYLGFTDPDGDEDASTISWSVNGDLSSTGSYADGEYVRDDTLTCTVTPSDGSAEGPPISASVTVENSAPSIEWVEMTPLPAAIGDTIHCNAWGFTDPDGDGNFSVTTWDINGGVAGISSSLSWGFTGGDTVSCTVVPNDGFDDGEAITRTQTIGNSPPSIASVSISPESPTVDDTLHCTYDGWSDVDGDPDYSTYRWLINGEDAGTSSEYLYGGFSSMDEVICQVTPYDGSSEGDMLYATVEIENTAPSISLAYFAPPVVGTDDVLGVEVVGFDGDGDIVNYQYSWMVDGEPAGGDYPMLTGEIWFNKDQSVEVHVTPYDAHSVGEVYTVGPIIVGNSPPESLDVKITPEHPDMGDHDLTCLVNEAPTDPDGDSIEYEVTWYRDGSPYEDALSTDLSGDFIPAEVLVEGETWTCEIVATDDDGMSVSDSHSVFIAGWMGRLEDEPGISCAHVRSVYPAARDGVYYLAPGGETFEAYCDMTTDGGGWTLVAFAPSNTEAPEAFFDGSAYDRSACPLMGVFCRLSDDEINAILDWGSGTNDRLRLLSPGTPAHHKYYWDTLLHFSSISYSGINAWWSVATTYGGPHSPGCPVGDARGVGHAPSASSCASSETFGLDVTDRVFFASSDGAFVGGSSPSTFSWYAK